MASTTIIPPFLLPRGISGSSLLFFTRNAKLRLSPTMRRGSQPRSKSTSSSQVPHVLEKPDKFRPPSHPARRVMQVKGGRVVAPRNYPGPKLSAEELAEKKTRKYPHMFPPEGTVMHKFLMSRWIHVWISMSVLFSLAGFTFTSNFKRTSPFAHLLPPWSQLLTHPFATVSQFFAVIKMHSSHVTLQTAEKRKRNIDDVDKRREYRRAHGLEKDETATGLAGTVPEGAEGDEEQLYTDLRERKKNHVKKWFGIW